MRRRAGTVRFAAAASCALFAALIAPPALGDDAIDLGIAAQAFAERQALCTRDAGRLWGISLCGPIIFVDRATRTAVGNESLPSLAPTERSGAYVGTLPAGIVVANTSVELDGRQVTMVAWPLPDDARDRAILLMHESFHRIQAQLPFPVRSPESPHLDTLEGRYLLLLEWRALERAATLEGAPRAAALRDALAFRDERHRRFPGSEALESALERNEGLAEDTGVALSVDPRDRFAVAIEELSSRRNVATFTRSFAYGSGPAYGAFLDAADPGWRRRLTATSDFGRLLAAALHLRAGTTPIATLAARYDDGSLRAREVQRESVRTAAIARFRAALIDGPVLRLPVKQIRYGFNPNGLIALPGAGTVYPTMTVDDVWGHLEVHNGALFLADRSAIIVTAPPSATTTTTNDWTLKLAPGCHLAPAERKSDFTITCP